jgi:hypothetical protein
VNGDWTQLAPATPPSARYFVGAAYDSTLNQIVLFGGIGSALLGHTWSFHADIWFHLSTAGPSTRLLEEMTYDESDGYLLLFGGAEEHSGSSVTLLNDTWTYVHSHWTQLKPAVSPSVRVAFGLTHDQADGYVLLFGGEINVHGGDGNDTWSFHAGKWTYIPTSSAPAPRSLPGMVYDAADGYVLLFGGDAYDPNASRVVPVNDTWTYQAGDGTEITPIGCTSCGPVQTGRAGPAMVYDAWDGYVLLFGGQNATTLALGDTWSYLGGVWTNLTASVGTPPAPRAAGVMVYDSLDGYVLLFGGLGVGSKLLSDTWSYVSGVWTQESPAHNPGGDVLGAIAYDSVDKTVVYLNGDNLKGGTWLY